MTELEKKYLISGENLSREYYLQSLLQEAFRTGLLAEEGLEAIQLQLAGIMGKEIQRYTMGDSSSVKIETAQNILNSICYTIGLKLKEAAAGEGLGRDEAAAEYAVALLGQKPLDELLKQGRQHVSRLFKESEDLLEQVRASRLETPNKEYNTTVDTGIDSFFKAYDREFAAHEIPGMIDYPISGKPIKEVGIEYINEYLKRLLRENLYCRSYEPAGIHAVMKSFHPGYEELLINIYEELSARVLEDGTLPEIDLYEPDEREPVFVDGEKMQDESFRQLVDKLGSIRQSKEKVNLINSSIHSISDLVDLLASGCMDSEDFPVLFESLGAPVLGLLLKEIPEDLEGLGGFHLTEHEKEWQNSLISFGRGKLQK